LQNTPDDLTMLHMFKRDGLEPLKLAKYAPGAYTGIARL
jgi:hypothetical protein